MQCQFELLSSIWLNRDIKYLVAEKAELDTPIRLKVQVRKLSPELSASHRWGGCSLKSSSTQELRTCQGLRCSLFVRECHFLQVGLRVVRGRQPFLVVSVSEADGTATGTDSLRWPCPPDGHTRRCLDLRHREARAAAHFTDRTFVAYPFWSYLVETGRVKGCAS